MMDIPEPIIKAAKNHVKKGVKPEEINIIHSYNVKNKKGKWRVEIKKQHNYYEKTQT